MSWRLGVLVAAHGLNILWLLLALRWAYHGSGWRTMTDVDAMWCMAECLVILGGTCGTTLLVSFIIGAEYLLYPYWAPPLAPASAHENPDAWFTTTVFFPGNGADITQAARYTGPNGFTDVYNGHVVHRDAARLIVGKVYTGNGDPLGHDVLPHGLSYAYLSDPYAGIIVPAYLRGFLSGVRGGAMVAHAPTEYNFGQTADVEQGLRIVRGAMAAEPERQRKFILFGTSRGAAVALQVAARLTAEEAGRVRFLWLEGCFTDVPRVLTYRFGAWLGAFVGWVLARVTRYAPGAPTPLDAARAFPHKEMPVLLVTSRADAIVDPLMTSALYDALPQVEPWKRVLILDTSPHSDYATDNVADRARYAETLTGMYNAFI